MSQFPCNTVRHAVFGTVSLKIDYNSLLSLNFCAPSTDYIDPNTKLNCQFVLDWTVSSIFAPLPLRMSPPLNYASILSCDAVVN